MGESGIILPADSTGKATRTETVTTTFTTGSGGVVHMPVSAIGDPTTAANLLAVLAGGQVLIQGYQPTPTTFSSVTATGALASTSCTNENVATITLRTFTGTSPSVTWKLQASDDNTNWVDLQGVNNTNGQISTTWTQAAALTAGTAGPSIDYTIGAYTNVRINVTAISGTSATAAFGLALQSMPYEASPGILARRSTNAGGLLPQYAAFHLTSNTTTTITAATAYIQNVLVVVSGAGTAWTYKLQNKEGTPKLLIPATTAAAGTTQPLNLTEPVLATSGLDFITAGTTAGTLDVFITYWQ